MKYTRIYKSGIISFQIKIIFIKMPKGFVFMVTGVEIEIHQIIYLKKAQIVRIVGAIGIFIPGLKLFFPPIFPANK